MKDKNSKEQKKVTVSNSNNKEIKKKKKKNKKKKLWKKILLFIFIVLLIFIGWFIYKSNKNGGGLSGMLATVVGHDEFTKKNLPEIKVMILGVSNGIEAKLSDTIMIASYNPNTQKATLLSIPRDTFTGSNTNRATANQKINAIYSISEDPQKVLDQVNKLTNLNIQYYLIIETNALREVVDSIGGVKFDVPINMDYDDCTQNLAIHIKAGEQVLNGEQAEGVVRFRHNNDFTTYSSEYGDNDLGRMRTQREFLKAVMQQTLKVENIFKLSKWLEILNKNVKTNIKFDVAKDYLPYAVEFNTENLLAETLPGTTPPLSKTNGVSIFVADKTETKKMIQELFVDRDNIGGDISENTEENTSDNTTNKIENTVKNTSGTNTTSSKSSTKTLKVEIINGTGDGKKISTITDALKKDGYNVIKTIDSSNKIKQTSIVNRNNVENDDINKLKEKIGVGEISNNTSSSSKADVSIIIGTDYNQK